MAINSQSGEQKEADIARVQKAVAEARKMTAQGSTKIDAAMCIYRQLQDQSQETVVQAFIDGATLTERGALTYWYNCKRRINRERSSN